MIRSRVTRPGITLVEMMVAMALALGIMLILTESFKMALDFVRGANATGSLIVQLNGAGLVLGQDLKADHFLGEDGKPGRGVRLSDQRLDWYNVAGTPGWSPPAGGYFRVVGAGNPVEVTDANGFNVNAPATLHTLQFTSVLPGGTDQNLYTAVVNGLTYTSRAAEVAYFLVPAGFTGGAGSQQLYNLYRRCRLVAMTADDVPSLTGALADPTASDVISVNTSGTVNTLAMLASSTPANRVPFTPLSAANGRFGEDIVLTNVLSFEVLADWTPNPSVGGSNQYPLAYASGNTDAPYDFLSRNNASGMFDTYTPPQYIRIKSLQVMIRVFDPRMKYTRQNTWKFAM
jgi:hypothetical protein